MQTSPPQAPAFRRQSLRLALGPRPGLRAASCPSSARPPGKDGSKAPKGRGARARAGAALARPGPPRRLRDPKAAGSGETRVGEPESTGQANRAPHGELGKGRNTGEPPRPRPSPGRPWPAHGAGAGSPGGLSPLIPAARRPRGAGAGLPRASPGCPRGGAEARVVRGEKARRPGPGALSLGSPGRRPGALWLHAPPASRPPPGQPPAHSPCRPAPPAALGPAFRAPSPASGPPRPASGDAEKRLNTDYHAPARRSPPLAVQNCSSASHQRTGGHAASRKKKNSKNWKRLSPASKEGEQRASARAQRWPPKGAGYRDAQP